VRIVVAPKSQLAATLATSNATHLIALVSPSTEFERPTAIEPDACLHLTFNDIAEERDGLIAPTADHVRQLLAFAASIPSGGVLLVHCYAGVSRSTASAYAIACANRPDLGEEQLAAWLRSLSPSATPNPLLVAHSDTLLGREGRMVEAIRSIGRGAGCFEGEVFALDLAAL
jgi:predicted protein tyrosine phosphatase